MSRAHSSKKGSKRDLPCDATLKMVFGFIYLFATNRNAMSRAHSSKTGSERDLPCDATIMLL